MNNARQEPLVPSNKDSFIIIKPRSQDCKIVNIVNLGITTDSVVATVTINTKETMGKIVVYWGDDSIDTLRLLPGALSPPIVNPGTDEPLPAGVYQFNHAYEVPETEGSYVKGKPFEKTIQIAIYDTNGLIDYRFEVITITPRYRVIIYPLKVTDIYECEWFFSNDLSGEFRITRAIADEPEKQWDWDPPFLQADHPSLLLEGSGYFKEMEMD